ncbi:MAG: hypothetical protein JO256_08585 [Alphaproteobacteria bacterium]|nr:hypothetical protein [Alphaproteobacteria bacterium]
MTEPDPTEALLRSMVAECGEIIRLQLRPGMEADADHGLKWGYAKAICDTVKIPARAGEALARLHGSAETRHRIIVERAPEATAHLRDRVPLAQGDALPAPIARVW